MVYNHLHNYITLFLLFIAFASFSQGPWTQEKGKLYAQANFTTIPNYNTFFGSPEFSINGEITDNTYQLYGEYGLSSKTTVLLNLPVKQIAVRDITFPNITCANCTNSSDKTALGNLGLGVKHNFINEKYLLSAQVFVEANTSSYDTNSGIRTGYAAYTITPLLLAGKGFGKTYVQGFIGADIRTNNYSSNFRIGGEYGYKIQKSIWLIAFIDVVKSLKNGWVILPTENLATVLYVNDQDYGAYGLKVIGEITKNFGLTGGFGGAFFGNNVAKEAALNFGIYQKL